MNEYKMVTTSDYSSLNPALKAALSSLDLDLESELSRYRKLKNKNSDHTWLTPQVIPVESLDLQEIVGLVHQPDRDLSTTEDREILPPDDYLESSARLLSSLANNGLLGDQERILLNPVKTPWGVSSLLMLFLGASLLGLAFIPQKIWTRVPVVKSLVFRESNSEDNITNAESLARPNTMANSDLSESEFLSFNLNNLSTLKVKTKDQPPVLKSTDESVSPSVETTIETKAKPTPNEDLTKALLSPILNQVQSQTPSEPDTYSATTSISAFQLNKNYYYVFSDYKGDRTLGMARQVIRDAYLVQFPTGKKIQFGAFANQEDANRLVKQLQSRDISASVYDPKN